MKSVRWTEAIEFRNDGSSDGPLHAKEIAFFSHTTHNASFRTLIYAKTKIQGFSSSASDERPKRNEGRFLENP